MTDETTGERTEIVLTVHVELSGTLNCPGCGRADEFHTARVVMRDQDGRLGYVLAEGEPRYGKQAALADALEVYRRQLQRALSK